MDFFAQQDIARRNSRWLLLMFLAAVLVLITLANALIAAFLWFGQDYNVYSGSRSGFSGFLSFFSWARFGGIGLAVALTVSLVVMIKWIQLSTGGKVVAEGMGGTRILPQTLDAAERRCLNVVEEIALAANMPVPPVYVLNSERGINAFAAGITPADAVVAVTRGTLLQLKRDELQGVIAHEFSHILNGDMRLNIRLAAALKGITFVGDVGHILLRSGNRARTGVTISSDRNSSPALPLLGLALWVLGWLGGLAAGFIKAAISRQKEYLADASAVQYTRNPQGIGDALRVIGGYLPGTLVHAARATEMSHIFFGQIEHRLWQLFATHPPLEERIRRVDPGWDGSFIQREKQPFHNGAPGEGVGVGRAAFVAAAISAGMDSDSDIEWTAEEPPQVPGHLPETLPDATFGFGPDEAEFETAGQYEVPVAFVQLSHEPFGANALVLALLMSEEEDIVQQQLAVIRDAGVSGLVEQVNTLLPGMRELPRARHLPLLEMCMPALKSISLSQYRRFKNTLLGIIQADARTDLYEWCLFQLVRHYLDPEFIQVKYSRPRYRSFKRVAAQVQTVLSVLAHEASSEAGTVYALAANELNLADLPLLAREQCSVASFSKAVHELADCYPLLKPRLLKAMALAAGADRVISAPEKELITSIAAVMDCPVPDILFT